MGAQFTAAELADCAAREVKQRQRVYPRWVHEGKMTREFADRQIAMMQAIAEHFRARAEADPQASGLLF